MLTVGTYSMNGNRFEFLELGEDGEKPKQPVLEEDNELLLAGRDPIAERGPDGEPLAQVQNAETRGYLNYLQNAQDETHTAYLRSRKNLASGSLRAAEVFGTRGHLAGQFNFPTGLAVDQQGVLYIADSYNHRVQRITKDGGVSPLGGRGSKRGQFLLPQGAAIDTASSFYIVEQGNHRFQKFGADGSIQLVMGKLGSREGEFRGPTAIAVAPRSGDIYIADAGNNRVQRFDPGGYFVNAITSVALSGGMTFSPQAVAVDSDDSLYVADPFSGMVWQFDSFGRSVGSLSLNFTQPRALACAENSLLYVADAGAEQSSDIKVSSGGRVLALHGPQSRLLTSVEQAGKNLGSLARPGGLAVAPRVPTAARSDFYVSDTMNHRILRFTWE